MTTTIEKRNREISTKDDLHPFVTLLISGGTFIKTLIDTGASKTLLQQHIMETIASFAGQTLILSPTNTLVAVTGHNIEVKGETEVNVEEIGPVAVVIVGSMRHDCILGWDQL